MKKKTTKRDIRLAFAIVATALVFALGNFFVEDLIRFMGGSVSSAAQTNVEVNDMDGSPEEGRFDKRNIDANSSKTSSKRIIHPDESVSAPLVAEDHEVLVSEEQQIRKLMGKINRSIPLMYELEYNEEQQGITHGFLSAMYYGLKDEKNGLAVIKSHIDVQMALQQRTDIIIAGKSPNNEEPTPLEKILFRMADIYHASLKSKDNYTSSGYHEAYVLLLEDIWDRTITDYDTFQNRARIHLSKYSLPMPLR